MVRNLFLLSLFSVTAVFAQTLDANFNGSGKKILGLATEGYNPLSDVKFQPDGKLLACGVFNEGTTTRLALVRMLPNGSLDPSFGDGGKYIYGLGSEGPSTNPQALQLLDDGKFLVAGSYNPDPFNENLIDAMLMRFNSDGSVDEDFGNNGLVTTNVTGFEKGERVMAMAVQPDGKIIIAGYAFTNGINPDLSGYYEDFSIIRYNPDGSLDATFSSDGKLYFNIGLNIGGFNAASIDVLQDMKLQPDGKILLCGYSDAGDQVEHYHLCMVRLNADGTPDVGFGNNGIVMQNLGGEEIYRSIELFPDGGIMAVGVAQPADLPNTNMVFSKFNQDGTPDSSFGNAGVSVIPFDDGANFGFLFDASIDIQQRVVASGYKVNGGNVDFVVAIIRPDGTLDTNFNATGQIAVDFLGGPDYATAMDMTSDGDFIVVGAAGNTINSVWDFAATKFVADELSAGHSLQQAFKIYPNPFVSDIHILGGTQDVLEVIVSDISGRNIGTFMMATDASGNGTITLPTNLPSGIYLLGVRDNTKVATYKLVKG